MDGYQPGLPDEWKQRIRSEGADYILVTHGHFDHVNDLLSLATLTSAKIVCQFDIVPWLTSKGVNEAQIIGFNKGGTIDLGGVKATMTHATHSSSLYDDGVLVPMGTEAGFCSKWKTASWSITLATAPLRPTCKSSARYTNPS